MLGCRLREDSGSGGKCPGICPGAVCGARSRSAPGRGQRPRPPERRGVDDLAQKEKLFRETLKPLKSLKTAKSHSFPAQGFQALGKTHDFAGEAISFRFRFVCARLGFRAKCRGVSWLDGGGDRVLRRRDLVPPGEKDSQLLINAIQGFVDAGAFPRAVCDAFFSTPRKADVHLRFLTKELHKEIVSQFSVDESDVALDGASYGGLFSLYALGEDLKFCAASPAIFDTDLCGV